MKKIIGIAILVLISGSFLLPAFDTSGGEKEQIEFVGAKRCRMCHNRSSTGKYYDNWEEKGHASAWDLLNEEEKKDPKCQKCHTTGFGEPGGFQSLDDKDSMDMVNVQCEMCHGPGGKHIKSKKDDVIPHAWEPSKEVCVKCHNEESPTWDPERYTDEEGNTAGFIYEIAVKKVNHSEVREELEKEEK